MRKTWPEWITLEGMALLAIMLLALGLRVGAPGVVEFKQDEANLSRYALDLTHGRAFPLWSIDSSVGIRNPPIAVYVMALPYLISSDPTLATAYVGLLSTIAVLLLYCVTRRYYGVRVALIAALLYAANPWAVFYARKIWDLLPLFIPLIVGSGLLAFIDRKRWAQVLHVPLLALGIQVHFGAALLIPITLFLIISGRRHLTRWFALSLVLSLLTTIPYAFGAAQLGYFDVSATLKRISASSGNTPHPIGFSLDGLQAAALLTAGTETYLPAVLQAYSDDPLMLPDSTAPLALRTGLGMWIVIGLSASVWLVIRTVRRRDARALIDVVVLLWAWITPLVFSLTWTHFHPHYLLTMLPAAFVLVSTALMDGWQAVKNQHARGLIGIIGALLLIGMAALQSYGIVARLAFVDTHDTSKTFGTPLHYLMAVRQAILDQHPHSVLALLDGQYIGYHDEATIWNTLLYDVPSVRFLDENTEVYPLTPAVYLSHRCFGNAQQFYLRPPGEGCYAVGTRSAAQITLADYAAVPNADQRKFANGARVLRYAWQIVPRACLKLIWTADGPVSEDYNFSVHFLNASGSTILSADGLSWRGQYWRQGDMIVRTFCPTDHLDQVPHIIAAQIGMYTYDGANFHTVALVDQQNAMVGQAFTLSLVSP